MMLIRASSTGENRTHGCPIKRGVGFLKRGQADPLPLSEPVLANECQQTLALAMKRQNSVAEYRLSKLRTFIFLCLLLPLQILELAIFAFFYVHGSQMIYRPLQISRPIKSNAWMARDVRRR
tara:strand:+ start:214 stop:579 length:366 start_codon:yes stop_codon:yes gene_type:complete